jgi:hypothetical protein
MTDLMFESKGERFIGHENGVFVLVGIERNTFLAVGYWAWEPEKEIKLEPSIVGAMEPMDFDERGRAR